MTKIKTTIHKFVDGGAMWLEAEPDNKSIDDQYIYMLCIGVPECYTGRLIKQADYDLLINVKELITLRQEICMGINQALEDGKDNGNLNND